MSRCDFIAVPCSNHSVGVSGCAWQHSSMHCHPESTQYMMHLIMYPAATQHDIYQRKSRFVPSLAHSHLCSHAPLLPLTPTHPLYTRWSFSAKSNTTGPRASGWSLALEALLFGRSALRLPLKKSKGRDPVPWMQQLISRNLSAHLSEHWPSF